MRKRILKILFLVFLISGLVYFSGGINSFLKPSTTYAVGDLTVNWGVPEGDPIFVVSNFAPGETETQSVDVQNDAATDREVGIRGIQTALTDSFADVLEVTISEGGTDLYGPKTLAEFFADSTLPNFVPLSTLGSSASTTYDITVKFSESAGNEFQNQNVVFDLEIGIDTLVPAECQNITFTGQTIFGTSGNDRINGTTGNDLIFGLEGNDRIFGFGGNDCIVGGLGNDELRGETGNDVLSGDEGNDLLIGAVGNDTIFGGDGDDNIRGENNNDIINAGIGDDRVTGGNGDDVISGGPGTDNLKGENGTDQVGGDLGDDTLDGGAGNDSLIGGSESDSANGQAGTDSCDAETEIRCEQDPTTL